MNRTLRLLLLAVLALAALTNPRASAAVPDVPFFGSATSPNLPDSYMPGKKLNTYTAADWTTGAFTLESGAGLAYLQDVGVDFRKQNPDLLSTNPQDVADLAAQLGNPNNKKKVSIRTKTDSDRRFLYVVFEVQDSTIPKTISTSGPADGDRVTVLIDPENNKKPVAPGAMDTRYRITYQLPRPEATVARVIWSKQTGDTVTPQDEAALPADFKLAYTSNDLGYTVAMQIPFGMVGLIRPVEFGLGFSVVNVTPNKLDGFPLAFAISYPNTPELTPTTPNLPYNDDGSITGWENQANWGTGYLRGDLSTIVIRGGPPQYHSADIRIGTAAATRFEDISDYSVDNITKWYKYRPADPCKGRFWARVHRKVPADPKNLAARDIKVRVLFLWGPAGVPPVELYYIGLSEPFLVRRDVTDRVMFKPVLWNRPVKGLPGHPCILAVVLPEVLDHATFSEAKFKEFQTHVDSPAMADPYSPTERAKVRVDLDALMKAYSLTNEQLAQMNIDPNGQFVCPDEVPLPKIPEPEPTPPPDPIKSPVALRGIGAALEEEQFVALQDTVTPKRPRDEPPVNPRDVLVDFEAFSFIRPNPKSTAVVIQPIGGVRKLVNAEYLKKSERLVLTFNVTNTGKESREIILAHFAKLPPELKDYRVEIPPVGGTFRPGETRAVDAVLTSQPPAPPPVVLPPCIVYPPPPCVMYPSRRGPLYPDRPRLIFRRR